MKQTQSNTPNSWRATLNAIVLAFLAIAVVSIPTLAQEGAGGGDGAEKSNSGKPRPTIVLVHGAWADGSSWSSVVKRLQNAGYTVDVPPNPLRSLASDSATIASFLTTVTGPIVLVGHSYGGAVISNAAVGNPNVKALVFIDAFVPDQGESLLQLASAPPPPGQPASCLAGDPASLFNLASYPGAPAVDFDLYIKPSLYPTCFVNDVSDKEAAVLAATQRPIKLSALAEPSGVPAWKTIPSWYLVGTLDNVIPPYAQMFMAQRANSTIVQVKASHPAHVCPSRCRCRHHQVRSPSHELGFVNKPHGNQNSARARGTGFCRCKAAVSIRAWSYRGAGRP